MFLVVINLYGVGEQGCSPVVRGSTGEYEVGVRQGESPVRTETETRRHGPRNTDLTVGDWKRTDQEEQ